MTRDQRLSILGQNGIDQARLDGADDQPPSPEQIERLRRILSGSVRKTPVTRAA